MGGSDRATGIKNEVVDTWRFGGSGQRNYDAVLSLSFPVLALAQLQVLHREVTLQALSEESLAQPPVKIPVNIHIQASSAAQPRSFIGSSGATWSPATVRLQSE